MRHQVAVIAEPFLGLGFRLAGLRHVVAESETAAARRLEEMLSDPRWGVVLVQENLVPEVPPAPRSGGGSGLPIVVHVPAPAAHRPPGEAEAYVAELLRRAVGYRVRLR